jgi:hypothetical protein
VRPEAGELPLAWFGRLLCRTGELAGTPPDPQQGAQPPLQLVRLTLRLPDVRRVAGGLVSSESDSPLVHQPPGLGDLTVQGIGQAQGVSHKIAGDLMARRWL